MSEKEKPRRKRASSEPEGEDREDTRKEPSEPVVPEESNEPEGDEDDDGGWIGPMPSAAAQPKKRKGKQYTVPVVHLLWLTTLSFVFSARV